MAGAGGDATVDEEVGAVDEACFVGGEERNRRGDLFGTSVAVGGIAASKAAREPSSLVVIVVSGVSMAPGDTALTRMPSGPNSRARARVRLTTPALAAL